jgi:hypothetical protein
VKSKAVEQIFGYRGFQWMKNNQGVTKEITERTVSSLSVYTVAESILHAGESRCVTMEESGPGECRQSVLFAGFNPRNLV